MNILEEFLKHMASAIIFLQGRQPHKDCLWWLRLQPAWQKQQETYFISPLTTDYGNMMSNYLILNGQNLIQKSWTFHVINKKFHPACLLKKLAGWIFFQTCSFIPVCSSIRDFRIGICNEKMFSENATKNHPTIYSAHQPKLAKIFGTFLKKVLIRGP